MNARPRPATPRIASLPTANSPERLDRPAQLRMLFGALTQRWTNLTILTPPDIEPNVFAGAVRTFDLGFELR